MYKLYGAEGSCSMLVEIVLEMTGKPYEQIFIDFDKETDSDYLKINSMGEVPVLVEDDIVMTQSVAIATYLADSMPEIKMSPALDAPERRHYLQWMTFLNSTVHETYLRYYYPDRYVPDEKLCDQVEEVASSRLVALYKIINDNLGEKKYLLGTNLMACDIYMVILISWEEDWDDLFERHPHLGDYFWRVLENSAVHKVFEAHGSLEDD